MNLPFILDVAIGLIFIFLILSLLVSEIQELITTLLQWRAKHLRDSIENLLTGGVGIQQEEQIKELVNKLYDHPLIRNINQEAKGSVASAARQTTRVFPGNRRGAFGINQNTGPSYIAGETFATSLIEQLGLASLLKKLVEVRLEKFASRIIGVYDGGYKKNLSIEIPSIDDERFNDLWNKGRIRLIAEKAEIDFQEGEGFQTLVEEFDDILNDFEAGEASLSTSVERMEESFSNYINIYLIQKSSTNNEKLNTFIERLKAFKLKTFGQKIERAIASGGLQPSLLEIAELINQTSSTYKEIIDFYENIMIEGKTLNGKAMPLLESNLMQNYLEIIEQQIIEDYPQEIEKKLKENHPQIFQGLEAKLQSLNTKLSSALLHKKQKHLRWTCKRSHISSSMLVKQRQYLLTKICDQLTEEQATSLVKEVLNSLKLSDREKNSGIRAEVIDKAFNRLSNNNRYLLLDQIFTTLSQQEQWTKQTEKKNRSLYENYQTYKAIRQTLDSLPSSTKESLAILARRAQTRITKTGNDIDQLREEVSIWFDRSMSRASGVYKRNAKGVGILIGLLLVITTNVDAGFIVGRLSVDEDLRNVIVERAATVSQQRQNLNLDEIREETNEALNDLALPVGWNPESVAEQLNCDERVISANEANSTSKDASSKTSSKLDLPSNWTKFYDICLAKRAKQAPISQTNNQVVQTSNHQLQSFMLMVSVFFRNIFLSVVTYPRAVIRMLFGWLIAAIAISMGAPFWFDLLGKIVNVRNSGGKPTSIENQSVAKQASTEIIVKQQP